MFVCVATDSAYLRKDWGGPLAERFRLAEGAVPDNVAASLAQRKRWHKGQVELSSFLGVACIVTVTLSWGGILT